MNVLEAIEKMKEGHKITKANNGWYRCYAFYDEDYDKFYLYNEETNSESPLTVSELTDLDSFDEAEELLDLNYEIYESEDDKLIRKGKLLDIAMFCDKFISNNRCGACPLITFCPKNDIIKDMYRIVKEYRGV